MQVRVNIELEGDPTEVGLMLARLGETILIDDEFDDLDEDSPAWWTPERADEFVRDVTDPALQALGVIAANGPRISFRDFQRKMGMTGQQLAGRLSSIGFAVARQGAPFPFQRDYYQRVYTIDETVAAVLNDATASEMTRRREQPGRGRRGSSTS